MCARNAHAGEAPWLQSVLMAATHTDETTPGTPRSRRFARTSGARRPRGHEGRFARSNPNIDEDLHVEAPGTGLVIYTPPVQPDPEPELDAEPRLSALDRFAERAGRLAANAALAFRR